MSDKINVIEVDLSNLENKENTWNREKAQRNAAKDLIEENDICIVSDLDEIINPIFINYYALIAKANPNNILRIPLVSLNTRADLRVFKENGEAEKWENVERRERRRRDKGEIIGGVSKVEGSGSYREVQLSLY